MADAAQPAPEPPPSSAFAVGATRPVAISMVILACVVFGFVGLARLPVNLLPELSYPSLTVRTEYPGASPVDVEERVSQRVQESVAVVPGVRRAVSVSRPGVSDVILQFQWGTRMVFAVSDVRERLDRVFLPREARAPLVLRYDPTLDPVMTFGLSGNRSQVELRRIAEEEIERELAGTDGIAAVKVRGGEEEEIRIAVDDAALTAAGLDVGVLAQRLQAENLNAESGKLEEGHTEYLVRALNEFRDLGDIEEMIVETRAGVPIRIKDVAKVRRVPQDRQVISRMDGRPCVLIDVYKEADANIVDLCRRVRERVFGTKAQQEFVAQGRHLAGRAGGDDGSVGAAGAAQSQPAAGAGRDRASAFREAAIRRQMTDWLAFQVRPFEVELEMLQDQSTFIRDSVEDVRSNAVTGGLLAILVIWLFLRRLSLTAILASMIPISLVITFAPLYLSGVTLNIMSLGGLALGIGNLTDNAIVILESIERAREEGMERLRAAVTGTARVAGAVIASTATTVAVFFPIVFVEGVAGQLFRDLALAVVYSQIISLLVALFGVPMLATRGLPGLRGAPVPPAGRLSRGLQGLVAGGLRLGLRGGARAGGRLRPLLEWPATAFDRGWRVLEGFYPRVVRAALARRPLVLALALAAVALAAWRLPRLGTETVPEVHQGELYVDVFLPRDATVERTDAVIAPLERKLADLPDVARTFSAVGVDPRELNDSDQGAHSARILVRLKPSEDRAPQEDRFRDRARAVLDAEPQVLDYRFARPSALRLNAPLSVEIIGRELVSLRAAATDVEAALRGVEGLRDVRSTLQRGNIEVAIKLDREKLAALGLDALAVAKTVQTKVQGNVATRFAERERKIDVRVRIEKSELDSYARLLALNVNPHGEPAIPLESVAELRRLEGPSEIRRIGNQRGAEVQAGYAGLDVGTGQRRVEAALGALVLPRGTEARIGGDRAEMERSQQSLMLALALAVFLVYVVLASQFESLVQPMIVMVSVPLALVGVVPMLELLGVPLSVMVFLGAIVLAGIVVNNGIVMIDQINQLRDSGMERVEAIVRGAQTRLRPVAMTSLCTVLGLLPMTGWLAALPVVGGVEEGLELRAPMAITILAGLTISTLLTLVVVPVLYSLTHRRRAAVEAV